MVNSAITKIQAEMDANKDNSYIQLMGKFFLDYLKDHPEAAEKLASPEKTITNSLKEMEKVARSKKGSGNMAMLTYQEGFDVVFRYFGITGQAPAAPVINPPSATAPTPTPKPAGNFNVRLEDLL